MIDTKKHLILYVDDEKPNRVVFEASFGNKYRIQSVDAGEKALEILKDGKATIAALVTDQRMPGMSGDDLLAQAKLIAPSTIRIVITAYSDLEPILRAVNEGLVLRYIIKPWDRKELDEILTWAVEVYEMSQISGAVHERLAHAERLLTLGQVAAAVVHDVRGPLSFIQTTATQLVALVEGAPALPHILAKAHADPSLDAEQRTNLELLADELLEIGRDIVDGANAMNEMLKDIRRFEKNEAAEEVLESDPTRLLKIALSMCRYEVRHVGAVLDLDAPEDLPLVRIRATHFLQIVINLVRNAAQAVGRTGKRGRVLVEAVAEGALVRFAIVDEGPGMASDVIAQIGKPFFTTRPEGTGLGIGQVQRLLGSVSGTFAIESNVGRGTAVTFTIPKA
jgi:signal transduction histidine kinase